MFPIGVFNMYRALQKFVSANDWGPIFENPLLWQQQLTGSEKMRYTGNNSKEAVFSIMKDNKVKAVIEDDFVPLLKTLGIYQDIVDGQVACMYCGQKVGISEIEAIVPVKREVKIVCSTSECRNKLLVGGNNDSERCEGLA